MSIRKTLVVIAAAAVIPHIQAGGVP